MVKALAVYVIVPCGSSWVAGAEPDAFADGLCAAVGDCSAAAAICVCRAKRIITTTKHNTIRAAEEMKRNLLDNMHALFPGSKSHLNSVR